MRTEFIEEEMSMEQKWAMVDAAKDEVEERLGYSLTDTEWDEIVENCYDDNKDDFLDFLADMASEMECANAPAE